MDDFLGPFLAVWWVFPAAVGFSTVAIASGVSGALFFSPFFMLVVGLSPVQAVGAGLLTEMISAGLPEISTTQLVVRCGLPPRVAIATSVFVLALTAVVGAGIHAAHAQPLWHVVAWSVPGVLVGSLIGSRVGKHVPGPVMEKALGVVFALVGGLVLWIALGR